jgi:hypothetical protein
MGFDKVIFRTDLKAVIWKDVASIHYCHKREDWQTLANTAIHISLYLEAGNFQCISVTRTFSRMTLVLELFTTGEVMCNTSDGGSQVGTSKSDFFSRTYIPCILIIIKDFSPTDAQLDSLKNNFKFALKFTLKNSYMFRCKTP